VEVLQAPVDSLRRTVARAGSFEVGRDVGGPLRQSSPERDDFREGARDAVADRDDELVHQVSAVGPVELAVGRDHVRADAPGGLNLNALIGGEQLLEVLPLVLGERVGTRVRVPPGAVERVVVAAAVAVGVLLDAAPATVQGIAGQAHDVAQVQSHPARDTQRSTRAARRPRHTRVRVGPVGKIALAERLGTSVPELCQRDSLGSV